MEQEKQGIEPKPKKSFIKKFFKVLLYIVFTIVGINLLLYILLSIPFIQQKVADFAVNELKSTLKTEISIEEVRLSLFNQVTLKGLYIEDQTKDTLLYAQSLDARIDIWQLIQSNKIAITGIDLDDFIVNINQKDSISDYNYQFIIDAFSRTDTTAIDTTKSSLLVVIKDINLKRGRLNYQTLSKPHTADLFNASHILVYDLNANVDINSVDPDNLDIVVNALSAKDKSGLEIKNLTGHLLSEASQLRIEDLNLELPDSNLSTLYGIGYNTKTEVLSIDGLKANIAPKDLKAFLPNLKFMNEKINLEASIHATLPEINIEYARLTYGDQCALDIAQAGIADYKHYSQAFIHLVIDKLKISPQAITDFAHLGDSTFVAPDILTQLGDIVLQGKVSGEFNNFKVDADAWCQQGSAVIAARGSADSIFDRLKLDGNLQVSNFNLAKIATPELGRLSGNIGFNFAQKTGNIDVLAKGKIYSLQYGKETLKDVFIDGSYTPSKMRVSAQANWKIGSIYADAEMLQGKVDEIAVNLAIDTLHIDRFYANENWVNPRLTFRLKGNMRDLNIDHVSGKVDIDSLDFHDDNFQFSPGEFALNLDQQNDSSKSISLSSSLFNASINGKYKIATLPDELSNLMHDYATNVFPETKKKGQGTNNFRISVRSENTEQLGKIFSLPVDIVSPAFINGTINTIDRKVTITGILPHIRMGETNIRNTQLIVANVDSVFNINATSRILMDAGGYNASVKVTGANNSMRTIFDIASDSVDINIGGRLDLLGQFTKDDNNRLTYFFEVVPSTFKVGNLDLSFLQSRILHRDERTEVHNFGIALNRKKYMTIEGVVSNMPSDSLNVTFNQSHIEELLGAFDIDHIKGVVDGKIRITNLLDQPELYTDNFQIADIIVFADTLGTMSVNSRWNREEDGIKINALLQKGNSEYARIEGMVYAASDSLDLGIHFNGMPVGWSQPFASDFVNTLSGTISSDLKVKGKMSTPEITGYLGFNNTKIGVDYTNVVYLINDTIQISPDRVGFDNLVLTDPQGNKAKVNATITHNKFKDMRYTLDMNLDKFMLLNTKNRVDSLFSGVMYASGNVKIEGSDNEIKMNVRVKNDKNSSLNILIPQTATASDYESVVYINVPPEKLKNDTIPMKPSYTQNLPLKLTAQIELNSDLNLGVVIDPVTGDMMHAKGNGAITFTYNMQTDQMNLLGDYTLTDGNVKINLQGLKKLDFKIQEGSKVIFIGNPMKSNFDITAYRTVRADLKSLDPSFDVGSSSKVEVNCVLGISGDIDRMNLTYNISLPNASEDIQRKVASIISTDQQKIKQFAYLIATGGFLANAGASGTNFSDAMWTNIASSTLSQGLNSAFKNLFGNKFEIGTSIESYDGSFSDVDMSVNLSTKLFNDKLKIKTDLGYRTDQTASETNNSFIGDFDVEYQLNALWILKAYNHMNDKFYKQAASTQGIGIVYSKEASTLKRLFQSFKPSSRQAQEAGNSTSDSIPKLIKE